jgi:hypothetical protein
MSFNYKFFARATKLDSELFLSLMGSFCLVFYSLGCFLYAFLCTQVNPKNIFVLFGLVSVLLSLMVGFADYSYINYSLAICITFMNIGFFPIVPIRVVQKLFGPDILYKVVYALSIFVFFTFCSILMVTEFYIWSKPKH